MIDMWLIILLICILVMVPIKIYNPALDIIFMGNKHYKILLWYNYKPFKENKTIYRSYIQLFEI